MKIERQRTLVLVKPDGVERGLIGEVIRRFENRGLKIAGMKLLKPSRKLVEQHYDKSIAKKYGDPIRDGLVNYIVECPVVAIALEGVGAIKVVRSMVGATYPDESAPGTIRGDFCHISKEYANSNELIVRNIVHASADEKDAKKELGLWFSSKELLNYTRVDEVHIW